MKNARRHCHSAFTLIELLTVMAISAVLLTIILIPLFQSFNLTRQAQALADAQDKGRQLTEKISREMGDAVAVREGARVLTTLNGATDVPVSGNSLIVTVPKVTTGTDAGRTLTPTVFTEIILPFSKIDLIKAARGEDSIDPLNPGVYVDPVSKKYDPTLNAPKGDVKLPVAPGQTIVRWFVGLHNPFLPYNNPYDGLLVARNAERDNLFVLYRAEVTPRRWTSVNLDSGGTKLTYVTDSRYFDTDGKTIGTDVETGLRVGLVPKLDDPRFFLDDGSDRKEKRIGYWQSKAVVQTEISRYDMVQTLYDLASRRVKLADNTGTPQVVPLIQFRPDHVGSDPAEGMTAVRPGEESGDGAVAAPDVFTTKMGLLTNVTVRTWPVGWRSGVASADKYLVGRFDAKSGLDTQPPGFSIYAYDPEVSSDDYLTGTELFDVTTYNDAITRGLAAPATRAMRAANIRSNWMNNANLRSIFTPYNVDTARGRITASFPIDEFGSINPTDDPTNPSHLPTVAATADQNVYTPNTEPSPNRNFYDVDDINGHYNVIYNLVAGDAANARGLNNLDLSRVHRAIDLRVVGLPDGAGNTSSGPLDPRFGFKASIVPGSEIVQGPDQTPGAPYNRPVRYVRVNSDPGINQYALNYKDRPEPGTRNADGTLNVDYSVLGVTAPALNGFDPTSYDAKNFVSAVLQPQYKAGYLQLNSNPNQPLPPGNIQVFYRVQFTAARSGADLALPGARQDTFAVDYDSRELMNVLLTIRNYPQSSLPNPQNVTLKATARVRNYLR